MNDVLVSSLMQLLGQTPVLLVYLLGPILALVFWRRCPVSSLLTLVASVLLLLLAVIQAFATQYLIIRARVELGWSSEEMSRVLSAVALVGNVLRALGLGLLLAAVFLGRRAAPRAGPLPHAEPAVGTLGDERITTRPGR